MKQFLLLRSNKQTGPYSAEELQQMGLKPYDLIWVNGKSAAWRYPGEVEELKSFAPPVEEQPYDRFYKKPEAASKNQESVAEPPVVQAPPATVAADKPAPKKEKEYKRVFVTLPSNATAAGKPVGKPVPAVTEPQHQQYIPKEIIEEPLPEPVPVQEPDPSPAPAPVKKSQPVAQPRKAVAAREAADEVYFPRKKAFRIKPPVLVAIAIGMVSMIALGIWIGLSIDKKEQGVSLIRKVDAVPDNSNKNQGGLIDQSSNATGIPTTPDSLIDNRESALPVNKKPARVPTPASIKISADSSKQYSASKEKPDSGDVAAREELRVKKPVPKPTAPNLEKMVSVTSNDYKVGPFGGISKLALTVKNSSEYNLNLVVVQVEYLKVNKEVFKTENLYFRDLAANSSLTLGAPRSNRGNTINYKVTLINSKDHLFHAGN